MLFVPRFCSSAGRFSTSRAAADGLVDPLTVQVEQQIPPTDRQMDYALEFEVMIPDGVCKDDVSAIISRIADEDEEAPDPGLSRYAHACGVKFSRFVGAKALLGFMVGQLQGAARAELYAYAVNRQEKGGSFSDPRRLPVYDALRGCRCRPSGYRRCCRMSDCRSCCRCWWLRVAPVGLGPDDLDRPIR